MILIIDNYDSFVYNLVQRIGELGWDSVVYRNDEVTPADIEELDPSHLIVSPGPCSPLEAGISNDVIRCFAGRIPILGVCLGHQCIGHVFGGQVIRAPVPTHGKSSPVHHDGKTIFEGLPDPLEVGRYHSLVIRKETLPPVLELSAWTADNVIMGVRHKEYAVEGVQFHPESVMTESGYDILRNFLKIREPVRKEAQAWKK